MMNAAAHDVVTRPIRVIVWGEAGSAEIEFDPLAGATIGRDERCTIALDSSLVSRHQPDCDAEAPVRGGAEIL